MAKTSQGIFVCVDIKGQHKEVLVKFLNYSPFEGEKFQFMGRVVRFGPCQIPTGVGDDDMCTIIMSLVEHSPKTDPQASVWSVNGLVKST